MEAHPVLGYCVLGYRQGDGAGHAKRRRARPVPFGVELHAPLGVPIEHPLVTCGDVERDAKTLACDPRLNVGLQT